MARSNLSKAARAVAAKGGTALPNGKYPIRTRRELKAAIKLRHHSTEPYAKVRGHIMKRAAALGVKLKTGQIASAGPGTVVFACYSKACAPPPVGEGGSSMGGKMVSGWQRYPDRYIKGDYVITKNQGMIGGWNVYHQNANGNPDEYKSTIGGVKAKSLMQRASLKEAQRIADEHASPKQHPVITAAEARGDSKPVSHKEFQRLARIGQVRLDAMSANSSPIKLDDNWDAIKTNSYGEVLKSWGGATIDAHTGQALPQGANRFALTVKEKGGETVSIPQNASRAEFDAAMDKAIKQFRPILEREGHHLGVFRDDDLGRIDIDPVLVVDKLEDVHTIGAATRAIGGAYNFADGNGYWPPHVMEGG